MAHMASNAKLEKRVTALEQEVAALKKIVEKLTGGSAAKIDAAPSLPSPISDAANLPELAANEKEQLRSVKAAVTGYIKNELHEKFYTIDKGHKLGTGMNGTVYAVTDKAGSKFAIKSVSKRTMSKAQVEGIRTEIRLLSSLDHPNIVKLVEAFEQPGSITMILEICSGGELYDNLIDVESYSEGVARNNFRQMVASVGYVHQMGIAHRDLKLENFLFESKRKNALIKLIDFGLSKKYGLKRMNTLVGTAYYIAPEVLMGAGTSYGPRCDVWSLGVILFMMLTGWPPFGGDDDHEIMRNIKTKCVDFVNIPEPGFWKKLPGAQKLLAAMLNKDPSKRPSCAEVLKYPWMLTTKSLTLSRAVFKNLRKCLKGNKLKQATAQVVAMNLPSEKIRKIQDAFRLLDKDDSGHISLAEFKEGLQTSLTEKEATAIFNKVDIDSTGLVSYSEFLAASLMNSKLMSKERIMQTFDRLDKDRSGTLETSELRSVLKGIVSEAEVKEILTNADTDGDGVISRAEFLAAVQSE